MSEQKIEAKLGGPPVFPGLPIPKFQPIADQILFEPEELPSQTASGLHIAEQYKGKATRGHVLAVGPGARSQMGTLIPMDIVAGDIIVTKEWTGLELKIDGHSYRVIGAADVIGILK